MNTEKNLYLLFGTISNFIAYELDDLETPVTFIATQGIGGNELGRQEYSNK